MTTSLRGAPAFTYVEVVETGAPPARLTDEEWQVRLAAGQHPAPPAWTASFRLPAAVLSLQRLPGPLPQPTACPRRTPATGRGR